MEKIHGTPEFRSVNQIDFDEIYNRLALTSARISGIENKCGLTKFEVEEKIKQSLISVVRSEDCCSIASCIGYFGLFHALLYTLLHCAYPSMPLYVSLDCSVDGVSPPSGAIRNRRSIL